MIIWNVTGMVWLAIAVINLFAGKEINSSLDVAVGFLAFILAKMEEDK